MFGRFTMGMRPELGKAAGGAGGVTQIFYDTFTDSDSTALPSHTPDVDLAGNGWINDNGAGDIQSAQAFISSTEVSTVDVEQANVVITALVTPVTGAAIGRVVARAVDVSNYWAVSVDNGGDAFKIVERTGGTNTDRASTAITISNGVQYAVVVTLSGDDLSATLDGANGITYNSALRNTATKHGIASSGANSTFDNFEASL